MKQLMLPATPAQLELTVARLREKGYLDTSFADKEVHRIVVLPLPREEAFISFYRSGGETWGGKDIRYNPYSVPRAETLDVMFMKLNRKIGNSEVFEEMNALGVRPIVWEVLVQLGIVLTVHQESKNFVALGSKYFSGGLPYSPSLHICDRGRDLGIASWHNGWGDWYRFPVVCK